MTRGVIALAGLEVLDDNGMLGVIDLGIACWGTLLFDLGEAARACESAAVDFEPFLAAYRREAPLAESEYELIPIYRDLAVAWRLRVASWYALHQDRRGRWKGETYRLLEAVDGRPLVTAAGMVTALRSRLIMIIGVGPGIGKSTLAEGLVARGGGARLRDRPLRRGADLHPPAFAEVGHAFRERTGGERVYPSAGMLIEGYRRVVDQIGHGAIVFDWSCLGMISDLPWAEGRPDVLPAHARDVRSLTNPLCPVLINLLGEVEVAVARAAAQREDGWVRRNAHLAAVGGGSARSRLAAIAERIRSLPHESLVLSAFGAAGWPIWEVDAMRTAEEVLDDVAERLWGSR